MEINEYNTIIHNKRIIAHHYWEKYRGWLIVFEQDIAPKEREVYEKEIEEVARRNKIKVEFKNYGEN